MKRLLSFIIGTFLGFISSGLLIGFMFLFGTQVLRTLLGEETSIKIFEVAGDHPIYIPFIMIIITLAGGVLALVEGGTSRVTAILSKMMLCVVLIIPSYFIVALIEWPLRLLNNRDILIDGPGGGVFFPMPNPHGLLVMIIIIGLLVKPFSWLISKFKDGNHYAWGFTLSFILTYIALGLMAIRFDSILMPIIAIPLGFIISSILGRLGKRTAKEGVL